jgi:hypothetical protein
LQSETFHAYEHLVNFAYAHELKKQNKPRFRPSILLIGGSVPVHQDKGMGLLLSWLIHQEQIQGVLDCYPTQLVTRTRDLDLKVGDVFVFDSDQDHGWISNTMTLLIQMSIDFSEAVS